MIAITVAVYFPVWHHDFVNFDDNIYLTENLHVAAGLTWRNVLWAFTTGAAANWHPLTWLSHMLDVQIFGLHAGPQHAESVLFHIFNTLLLFGLICRLTGGFGQSAFVAAVFAVHPLHVESVAWAAERKDVLSTLFFLLAIWAYASYVRRPSLNRYLLVCALFVLGLMAKPMVVTLPFVLLLLDYWPLDRVGWPVTAAVWRRIGFLVWEKLPLFALTVISSIVTFVAQQRGGTVMPLDRIPMGLRWSNAAVSYVAYIGKMVWPARLSVFYPFPPTVSGWLAAGAILCLTGVTVVVLLAGHRHPYLPVGWLWYLGTLVPVIGLVQVGPQAMANRYTYVPMIGILIMVAWGLPNLCASLPSRNVVLPALAAIVIVGLTAAASAEVRQWKNAMTLWSHELELNKDNYVAHTIVGALLSKQGKLDEAIAQYSEALRIHPTFAVAQNDLGDALMDRGKLNEAEVHYLDALRANPEYAEAHNNLGTILESQGRITAAIAQYSEALRIAPDLVQADNNLGTALLKQGKVDEGVTQLLDALRLKPDFAAAHHGLGIARMSQGKWDEAVREFREALRLQPDYVDAHINLGAVLLAQGKLDEAGKEFSEVLRLKPDQAEAHNNLAGVLQREGRLGESAYHYSEAVRLSPAYAEAHYNFGQVLAQQGKRDESARQFEIALQVKPDFREARSALDHLGNRNKKIANSAR